MKRALPIAILITSVLILGCLGGGSSGTGIKDCGTDASCYQQGTADCGPVKVDLIGVQDNLRLEMRPSTNETCRLDITFLGTTNESNKFMEGKNATCIVYRESQFAPPFGYSDGSFRSPIVLRTTGPPPNVSTVFDSFVWATAGCDCNGTLADALREKEPTFQHCPT